MLRSKDLFILMLLGIIARLFSPLSTELTGIAHAQDSAESKISYLPLPDFGSDNQFTINFTNNGDTGIDVKVTAYRADGSHLGEISAITWLESGADVELDVRALPLGTASLKIESMASVKASLIMRSPDSSAIIPAINEFASQLNFPTLAVNDAVHKTLLLLNPSSSLACLNILVFNKNGRELGQATLDPLFFMQSGGISLTDFFDSSVLENISLVRIN